MYISYLKLENFKNLQFAGEIAPGINLIVAPNGTGKTNFLEAINYLADGNSFRGVNDELLFPFEVDSNFFAIEAQVSVKKPEAKDNLRIVLQTGKTKIFLYNHKKSNLAKFRRSINTLVHAPHTIDIVSGGSVERREFLDKVIIKLRSGMQPVFRQYQRAVQQKNRLLKNYQAGKLTNTQVDRQLDFWNEIIVSHSLLITRERIGLLQILSPIMSDIARKIYRVPDYRLGFEIESKYISKDLVSLDEKVLKTLKNNLQTKFSDGREKEKSAGRGLYGAHRDEYEFSLNNQSVRYSSSRGQQRLFSLILNLAALSLLQAEYGQKMILLLDDIFSELDPVHRSKTLDYLKGMIKKESIDQIFITSPDKRDFNKINLKEINYLSL